MIHAKMTVITSSSHNQEGTATVIENFKNWRDNTSTAAGLMSFRGGGGILILNMRGKAILFVVWWKGVTVGKGGNVVTVNR